jgi:outer membrane protein OmpA-like peptidoglycan-associated protein
MSTRHTRFRHTARIRQTAMVAAVLATLALHPAQAREAQGSKRGGAGFVSGAAVGAAAAGPLGMVVGGVVGGLMGERSHKKSEALAARKAESAKLAADLENLNLTLTEIESKAAVMGSTVQFRTGQTAVRDSDKARVARLGALVAGIPDVRVRVSGFADARGDDALNETLSQERAEMVARELEKAGVPRERLIVEAMGERFASVESTSDDQAFERSVEIRFESTASLAMQ